MIIFLMILLILVGMGLLILGANLFVDGAGGIAKKLKISPFVIGMTVVALGTSAPELAVSFKSVLSNSGDIAMGNVVGSNIINILLILGISSCIRNLKVEKKTLYIEIPFLILITGALILLSEIGGLHIAHWEGGILILLLAAYIAYMVVVGLRERKKNKELSANALLGSQSAAGGEPPAPDANVAPTEEKPTKKGLLGLYDRLQTKVWFLIVITLVGLFGVVLGAQLVVDNIDMLTGMMPEGNWKKILSVTVVALGTSLPELITSVVAAVKKDTGLALGNIIGSNILNILLILGLPALFFSLSYSSSFLIDMFFSLGAALLLPVCVLIGRGKNITRTGGILMLVTLCGYLVYLFLS